MLLRGSGVASTVAEGEEGRGLRRRVVGSGRMGLVPGGEERRKGIEPRDGIKE